MAIEEADESEEGDGIATPIPLPAGRPRSDQRFTITGLPGRWRLVADLTCTTAVVDVTRARDDRSTLAALGSRLAEFIRDKPGSEL